MVGLACAGALALGVLSGCISQDQITVQNQINSVRTSVGVRTLIDMDKADTKAQNWAQKLANDGKLSHSNLASGYTSGTWCHLGENVGMGPSLSSVQSAFIKSPGHYANMVNAIYDHVGTGVVKKGSTYYVVQEYADLC
jgi:uncharacterized protein YkwD